ncbi:Uu.00g042660.m01.CDS01 [Anthostomella pinea]|uniref:Uu.00g042660.m01.CDS01 n=1 Tax=Anthostomella pinea TaxID=933095 RepID=A0AAI8V5M3_9PEZI|nr:Uu.00g042660.m01.CDS01 [Anthostomella pinea]
MHPAWQIDDIRYSIFECLDPCDLARLARTAGFFFNVATDELWKTVGSMSPFLCCLPPDARRRPLQVGDIQRLNLYTSKTQSVRLESKEIARVIPLPPRFQPNKKQQQQQPDEDTTKTWEELWEEITKLSPRSDFLPNLRRVRFNSAVEELLTPLIGISGANLTHIYIKYIHQRRPESIVRNFLDQLQDTSKLKYLFVRDGEPDLVPSRLIQQSPLEHLRLDPRIHAARHEDFQFKEYPLRFEILQKETLEHLTIGLNRLWYSDAFRALDGRYLPALKTLWLNLTTFTTEALYGWTSNDIERSPAVFLSRLDNPELSLLNIKFPLDTYGNMFLDVVSAANTGCRLDNLVELALAGGGWFNNCGECGKRPPPRILPTDLRAAMNMLLPLPRLRILRLSVAPNFLDVLDLEMYRSIADGLPGLEKLCLGHREFVASSEVEGTSFYERVPLHDLAAFCSMLPKLVEVSVGAVDGLTLEERPCEEWACPGVTSLSVAHWAGNHARGVS